MKFYIVGTCPVCSSAGNCVALVNKADNKALFHCTSCGVAWRNPPTENDEINEMLSVADIAPLGVYAPTETFLKLNGFIIEDSAEYQSIFKVIN